MKTILEALAKSSSTESITLEKLQEAFREKQFIDYMLNHINNLIFVADENNRFVYVNDTVAMKYGYTKDELLTMSIGDIDINFDPSQQDANFWETFKHVKTVQFHSIHKDKNWNLYPVLIRAHYIEYENNVYNFGVVEDESYIQKLLDAQDGFVILTDGKKLVMANAKLLEFFGYKEFVTFMSEHRCICEFFIEESGFIYNQPTWVEEVKQARHKDAKVKIKNPNTNADHIFLVRAAPFDESRFLVTFTDITELEHYKSKMELLAITDGLTSLFNRRYFNKILPREINRAKRDQKYIAFMMIDVDYFKQYNDVYGHLNGDEVLSNIANTIKKHFSRASEFCFRLGGEEFGVVSSIDSLAEFTQHAEQLRISIEELHIEHDGSIVSPFVTVSAGIMISDGSDASEAIYSKADQELYRAKQTGRNRVCVYGRE
ncbi:diguanylate cyclase [Sulfuricurvum sp.]|uniref:sensor domain-containing diguanylate cyclase n=1 Tax=Sulfuricurvum sp. TaxID=2025608 RepID=UPI002D73256A|nr:diguanylate cyclase [Sulfuricurvum sp.]HZF69401.1 diguanylate cyclase [Sulfuricurvum sp.]